MARYRQYTRLETEYIMRRAGQVPAEVMAEQLRRTATSVRRHACLHGISLRVPEKILDKYWRGDEKNQATM